MIIRTWKIKGKGGGNHDINAYDFFVENNCISCGWSFPDETGRDEIKTFEDYRSFWDKKISEKGWKSKWNNQGVHQLFDNVQAGDYVWTRKAGEYYVTQIPADPKELFFFDNSLEAASYDCSVQLKGIEWIKVGKEDDVPGSVSVRTRNRMPICKIDNGESTIEVAKNEYTTTSLVSAIASNNLVLNQVEKFSNKKDLFRLIGYSQAEDVVALWLYDKFNYVAVPSTNKIGTQKYEFALMDGTKNRNGNYSNSKKVYIQVKNGAVDLRSEDYIPLLTASNEELWLVTTNGHIDNESTQIRKYSKNDEDEIVTEDFELNELLSFVFNPNKINLLPNNIKRWLDFFE